MDEFDTDAALVAPVPTANRTANRAGPGRPRWPRGPATGNARASGERHRRRAHRGTDADRAWLADLVGVDVANGFSARMPIGGRRYAIAADRGVASLGWRLTESTIHADGTATVRLERCADEASACVALTNRLIANARDAIAHEAAASRAATDAWSVGADALRPGAGARRRLLDQRMHHLVAVWYSFAIATAALAAHAVARGWPACPPRPAWLACAEADIARAITRRAAIDQAIARLFCAGWP